MDDQPFARTAADRMLEWCWYKRTRLCGFFIACEKALPATPGLRFSGSASWVTLPDISLRADWRLDEPTLPIIAL
jgi:hypothetical protein